MVISSFQIITQAQKASESDRASHAEDDDQNAADADKKAPDAKADVNKHNDVAYRDDEGVSRGLHLDFVRNAALRHVGALKNALFSRSEQFLFLGRIEIIDGFHENHFFPILSVHTSVLVVVEQICDHQRFGAVLARFTWFRFIRLAGNPSQNHGPNDRNPVFVRTGHFCVVGRSQAHRRQLYVRVVRQCLAIFLPVIERGGNKATLRSNRLKTQICQSYRVIVAFDD